MVSGAARQGGQPLVSDRVVGVEEDVCPNGRRLGILSSAWHNNGINFLRDGQRHLHVHERSSLALQRLNIATGGPVFRMGLTARVLDPVLSRLCALDCAAKYRLRYS